MNKILQKITSHNNFNLIEAQYLSGGDINDVFFLKCHEGNYVVKLNDGSKFPEMFKAEAEGLELLRNSNSFQIPQIIGTDVVGNSSYLLMEFIPKGDKIHDFWFQFASNLAKLHHNSRPYFGLEHDNYIGTLIQNNSKYNSASEFYILQRLQPQFKMASDRGFTFKELDQFYKNISEEIPKESSSLIHGDLWGGNYLVSENGKPVLIDPAVAFAPREMELAMMKLFGGFDPEVFIIYDEIFPLVDTWEKRLDLWQLYYLLVHLNIFGSGYLQRVKSIIAKYS